MVEKFSPWSSEIFDEEMGKCRTATSSDVVRFAEARDDEDFLSLTKMCPGLLPKGAANKEACTGNINSYVSASCVLNAAFELKNIAVDDAAINRLVRDRLKNEGAIRLYLSEKSGPEVFVMFSTPEVAASQGYEFELVEENFLTWEKYHETGKGGPECVVDDEDATRLAGQTARFAIGCMAFGLPPCAYREYVLKALEKLYGVIVAEDDGYIFVSFFADAKEDFVRRLLDMSFDLLVDLHMGEVRTFSWNGGQEARRAESVISSLWWTLLDSMRDGRLGRCAVCGKPFIATKERGKKRRYCGDACKEYGHKHPGETREPRKPKAKKTADNAS